MFVKIDDAVNAARFGSQNFCRHRHLEVHVVVVESLVILAESQYSLGYCDGRSPKAPDSSSITASVQSNYEVMASIAKIFPTA